MILYSIDRMPSVLRSAFSEWDRDSDDLLELDSSEDSGATFTLSYLRDIVGVVSMSSEVATIELSTEMQIRMDFEIRI